jgi:hypothetical protein
MTKQQTRMLITCATVVIVGILLFIVAKWLLALLFIGLVIGGAVFATESAKAQTTPTRPPTPVYHPPVQSAAAERLASYAKGYQAQSPSSAPAANFPFTPTSEPQPHEARPGERYEDPLVQYPTE